MPVMILPNDKPKQLSIEWPFYFPHMFVISCIGKIVELAQYIFDMLLITKYTFIMRCLLLLFGDYKFDGIRGSSVMKMNSFYVFFSFSFDKLPFEVGKKQMNGCMGKSQTEKLMIKSEIYMRQQNNNNNNSRSSSTLDELEM